MFKKSLWFGSISLVLMALFALNACSGDNGGSSPSAEEDPALQGDLGGIRPGAPVHNAQAQTVITGTNAVARITWGEGVSGRIFRYNGGNPVKAEVVITANSDYIFDKGIKEGDILEAFGNVTSDIDDEWTISEDYTLLSFTFSYEVAQAELDLSPLKDIKLVAGSANMPAFISEDILANLDPDTPPVNAYVSAATPETAIETALPAAGTPFKVRVEAAAAYGYKWPAAFDYQQVYESAAKVSSRISGSVLSLTLEFDTALQVISAIPAGNILPLFTTAPAGGAQIPVKLLLGTGAAAPNFTVEKELEWTGLTENRSVAFASRSISTPVKLIPNKGYTFTESTLDAAAIATAINAPAATFNQKAEDVKKDHNLEFTLTYPVTAVQIAQTDIVLDRISQNGLSDFYQPRIGQPVYTKLAVHPDAKFTLDSILWSDETGNEALTVYADRVIVASITLRAKPGYTFDKVNITNFTTALTANFTKDAGKAPEAKVVGTPDETLIFTLTYERGDINPPIITSGNSVVAGGDALNAGGGLEELFGAISGNTVTIPKETVAITLTTPPVIPAGKTLELASGAVVTTAQPLDAAGNITIGTGSSLSVSGDSDITGNVSLGQNSAVSLSGAATIGGNVTFAQGSGLALSGSDTTIGDSTNKATTLTGPATAGAAPAPIDLTNGTLNLIGNVTATNVTITSSNSSLIDIPSGALTLGTNASLVLNPDTVAAGQGTTGTLDGKVIVKAGAAIVDANENLGAWEVGSGGVIEIQHGGKAVMYAPAPVNGPITAIGTGPTASDPAYSPYVQLRDSTAVFTLKRGEYEVTAGKVYLANQFALGSNVTVKGELILEDDLIFQRLMDIDYNPIRLVGTSADSKLTIKDGKKITVTHTTETVSKALAEAMVPGLTFSGSGQTYTYTASSDITYTWNIETNQWDEPTP
jgi:hypothetical protein